MSRHRWSTLFLQLVLVVVAALLGIVTNYATSVENGPFLLRILQQIAAPAIGVLILILIAGTIVTYRLENPPLPKRVWDSSRAPYPGLDAFKEDEAAVFFGRDRQITDLVRRLHNSSIVSDDRFVALVGASGSGKSSLVQAGVIPRLRERRWLVLPVMMPGGNPMAALAAALADAEGTVEAPAILRRLRRSPDDLAHQVQRLRTTTGRRFSRLLLVVDQFEELLTSTGEHERDLFLSSVRIALERDRRLWLVATLRIEFLRDFLETTQAGLFENPMAIGAIGHPELAQAVEEPGRLAGMRFAIWHGRLTGHALSPPRVTVPAGCGMPSPVGRWPYSLVMAEWWRWPHGRRIRPESRPPRETRQSASGTL